MLAWGAPPGLLPRMPKLRWAQALTAGVEGWLALPDLPRDMTLTCARGTHRESMPENIMGALFYLTKPYAACVEDQKQSKWVRRVATPLTGQTLGILGLGAVGQDVARIASSLGMRVIGTKRNPAPIEGVAQVMPPERIDTVLAQADYVVLLLPATPQTENLINAERLYQMKPTAWLLNFGRGALIDDADLILAAGANTSPVPYWICSARSHCPRRILSGRPKASSCCHISAAAIPTETRSSPGCSLIIWVGSWTANHYARSSIAPPGIDTGCASIFRARMTTHCSTSPAPCGRRRWRARPTPANTSFRLGARQPTSPPR